MKQYSPSQKLLGVLLASPEPNKEVFKRLTEEFTEVKGLPSCDEQTAACFSVLYQSGVCDVAAFNIRTSGMYATALEELADSAKEWSAGSELQELVRERNKQNLMIELAKAQSECLNGKDPSIVREDLVSATSVMSAQKQTPSWQDHVNESEIEMVNMEKLGLELTTGLKDLDDLFMWRRRNLTICAGPTSHGKTAVALTIVERSITKPKPLRIGYLAFEDWPTLPFKLASKLYKIPLECYTRYFMQAKDIKDKVRESLVKVRQFDSLKFLQPMTLGEFELEMNRFNPDVIVLDYVQRYVERYGGEDVRKATDKTTDEFHRLCEKYNAFGLMLCQIKRREATKFGQGPPRRPSVNDLKESGNLENYADGVLLLWYPSKDDPNNYALDKTKYHIEVAKDKLGKCGDVVLRFDGSIQSFFNKTG